MVVYESGTLVEILVVVGLLSVVGGYFNDELFPAFGAYQTDWILFGNPLVQVNRGVTNATSQFSYSLTWFDGSNINSQSSYDLDPGSYF